MPFAVRAVPSFSFNGKPSLFFSADSLRPPCPESVTALPPPQLVSGAQPLTSSLLPWWNLPSAELQAHISSVTVESSDIAAAEAKVFCVTSVQSTNSKLAKNVELLKMDALKSHEDGAKKTKKKKYRFDIANVHMMRYGIDLRGPPPSDAKVSSSLALR